jgi:hypothetical protein
VELLDELLQPEGRAAGGLLLPGRDGLADLLVAEVDLPETARDETAGEQDERDQEVVAQQPASPALLARRARGVGLDLAWRFFSSFHAASICVRKVSFTSR